ncbi:MAG: XcyI family restriction endonuclease, partial [Bacteroidota bacterium]
SIDELQLLTIGPQLRGSANNILGQKATKQVFDLIRTLVRPYLYSESGKKLLLQNESSREVEIKFASDPDIVIVEKLTSSNRNLISIEIKGGRDISNIHNRMGEAEKSHQKAKQLGFFEFMTILSVPFDYHVLQQESPTTSHFFNLDQLMNPNSKEYVEFSEKLASIIGIKI